MGTPDPFASLRAAEKREWERINAALRDSLDAMEKERDGLRLALAMCRRRSLALRWTRALAIFLGGMVIGMVAGRWT